MDDRAQAKKRNEAALKLFINLKQEYSSTTLSDAEATTQLFATIAVFAAVFIKSIEIAIDGDKDKYLELFHALIKAELKGMENMPIPDNLKL